MKKELIDIVGESNLIDDERLDDYLVDGKNSKFRVIPENIGQISEIMKLAFRENLKVVPYGSGTKINIGNIPSRVDLLLSLSKLNKILEFNPDDLTVSVETGIKVSDFNRFLSEKGLFLPVDPPFADKCTIGGITAVDSNGPMRLKFGKIKDMVTAMKIILSDGSIVKTGARVVKNASGYNISRLYIGSMGTIGIIAEISLKLHPFPESEKNALLFFNDISDFINFCESVRDSFLIPSYLEYLSPSFVRFLPKGIVENFVKNYHLSLIGFDGFSETVDWQLEQIKVLSKKNNCQKTFIPFDAGNSLLSHIRNFYLLFADSLIFKVSVVIPEFKNVLHKIKSLPFENKFQEAVLSHFGSGIIYVIYPLDNINDDNKVIELINMVEDIAIDSGGNFMIEDIPLKFKEKVSVWGRKNKNSKIMKRIKEQFDPNNILNPGRFVGGI